MMHVYTYVKYFKLIYWLEFNRKSYVINYSVTLVFFVLRHFWFKGLYELFQHAYKIGRNIGIFKTF